MEDQYEHLSRIVRRGFANSAGQLESIKWEPVDPSFASDVNRAKLSWKALVVSELPTAVFLKIPSVERMMLIANTLQRLGLEKPGEIFGTNPAELLKIAHNQECTIYRLLSAETPIRMPKCYYSEARTDTDDGVLILEDLTDVANTPDLAAGLSLTQLKVLTKQISLL